LTAIIDHRAYLVLPVTAKPWAKLHLQVTCNVCPRYALACEKVIVDCIENISQQPRKTGKAIFIHLSLNNLEDIFSLVNII
jgi:hypothetical protein